MIKIYTISSCTSCKKAKTWLNNHQLPYKEQNLGKEPLTKEEILNILSKTENGVESIVSSKNRYAKALNCDIDELSVSEVIDLIQENPRILKSPILIDDKRLQVGYKEDDIRAFLPRSIRMSKIHKHVCVQHFKTKRRLPRSSFFMKFMIKKRKGIDFSS